MVKMEPNISKVYDVLIIDPASTEFNRGSFCYLPYILYSYLSSNGYKVCFLENFTVAEIDNLPKAKKTIICLWSYPQIECCLVLNRFLERDFIFVGYYPLIDKYGLRKKVVSDETILEGIKNYPQNYENFKYLLLSDCDMHLNKYEGIVYPLFTSYGCPRNCSFCPTSVNCKRSRIELPVEDVNSILDNCYSMGIRNIHFTDEDFFYNTNRTFEILKNQVGKGFNFIALGSVSKVQAFIDEYGEDVLIDSGIRIIEVGFETADTELSASMNKPSLSAYQRLSDSCKSVDIFWLTLTFFPGETISTLNKTGEFLRKNGFKLNEVYGRIATNGTEGGLGQFFQLYDGVKDYDTILSEGIILTPRPMRLIPSFIPHSFLNSRIKEVREIQESEHCWFDLYKINPNEFTIKRNRTIGELSDSVDSCIFFAICARLGIIK